MCGGASYWSRIGRIVYGAKDDKRGISTLNESILHPKTTLTTGVLEQDCRKLISDYFKQKRD
jgi:tRNA(adenine34) deaminase